MALRVLGISCYFHDGAAALLEDGAILAAAQEERFTRKKHDPAFPARAIEYCVREAGCSLADVDHVVYYEKPLRKFSRIAATYLAFAPRGVDTFGKAIGTWLGGKLFLRRRLIGLLRELDPRFDGDRLLFAEHHQSHAASAFFASPFEHAAILTMDGVGEWATLSIGRGRGNSIELLKQQHFPHSLGMLYSAFTSYTGFRVDSGEYKLMGLAPYGRPSYANAIRERLVAIQRDGSFWLDMSYFDFATGFQMTNERFHALFGGPPRDPDEPIEQRHMDLAASIQEVTEDIVLGLARAARAATGCRDLCLAGGVALNCVANGKLLRSGVFDRIWIQPAAGDAGGALGAALAAHHVHAGQPRAAASSDAMRGAYLGPQFGDDEVRRTLTELGARFHTGEIIERTVDALCEGKAVGWFQGRMEFGPRALGNRSIIGDPRSSTMQRTLNLKIKYRESFRPFAPSVLAEHVSEWFDLDRESPYMLLVADVHPRHLIPMTAEDSARFGIDKLNVPRSSIPAITHVDYSARIQTVHRETNPIYHQLLSAFHRRTGCPVLVNTSFNVRGEPIACTPTDAFRCFMGTELDVLVIGNCLLYKDEQVVDAKDYKASFAPD